MLTAIVSPELLRPKVSKAARENKFTIICAGIFLTMLFMSIFFAWSTGLSSSPTKVAECTSKVVRLATVGDIRDAHSYDTAIYSCSKMVNIQGSIYGS